MAETKEYIGGCHCKRFRYKFTHAPFDNGEQDVVTCNCSRCKSSGLLFVYGPMSAFELTAGSLDELTRYTFNTKQCYHQFCPTCGTEIMGGVGEKIGINVRTVDDIDLDKLKLKFFDGAKLL